MSIVVVVFIDGDSNLNHFLPGFVDSLLYKLYSSAYLCMPLYWCAIGQRCTSGDVLTLSSHLPNSILYRAGNKIPLDIYTRFLKRFSW